MTSAADARARAVAAARRGARDEARGLFAAALARFPTDPGLLNSAGNFHAGDGDDGAALRCFDRALALAPGYGEAAINRAVVLTRAGRAAEAAAMLAAGPPAWHDLPRYWTARGAAEIDAGEKAAAAASYDQALRREAANPRALTGRARVALDRGEADAIGRHERALAAQPGDPALLLGLLDALDTAGRTDEATAIAEALATQLPGWLPGMERLAAMRAAAGQPDRVGEHYAATAASARSPDTYLSWAAMLAGIGRTADAADVARSGRRHFPADDTLAMMEAAYRDATGDTNGAAAIFARSGGTSPDWLIHEARHRLRRADPEAAEALLARALATRPGDVAAWSLRDLAWRLSGDPRHDWLSRQAGLVAELDLGLDAGALDRAVAALDRLHDRAATPIGQSVRHGSQTRGSLFDRADPVIGEVAAAVRGAIERYRAALPPADPHHPLLRHRDRAWAIAGSWSIRLAGAGRHAAHIHPHGIVSSAAYLAVPEGIEDGAGWLELGRPPSDLNLMLAPIATVRPRPGRLVLFPSTLYHGTRPIAAGKRLTVAFDVGAA